MNKEVITMKFTKRILIMTALAVTAVVSTGFAYDYVCNNSQYNCNTNTQYNSDNNTNKMCIRDRSYTHTKFML